MPRSSRVFEICRGDCFNCPFDDCLSSHDMTPQERIMERAAWFVPQGHKKAYKKFLHRYSFTVAEMKKMQKAAAREGVAYGRPRVLTDEQRIEERRRRNREYQRRLKEKDPESYRAKQREYYHRKKEKKACATTATP